MDCYPLFFWPNFWTCLLLHNNKKIQYGSNLSQHLPTAVYIFSFRCRHCVHVYSASSRVTFTLPSMRDSCWLRPNANVCSGRESQRKVGIRRRNITMSSIPFAVFFFFLQRVYISFRREMMWISFKLNVVNVSLRFPKTISILYLSPSFFHVFSSISAASRCWKTLEVWLLDKVVWLFSSGETFSSLFIRPSTLIPFAFRHLVSVHRFCMYNT